MAEILIVDDDKDILRLLEYALTRVGHTVTVKDSGMQGLEAIEAGRPDLIVCDVMMPKMTGYDFCRQVRDKPDFEEVPIIMFSARFQPIDKTTAIEAGATDYLPKTESPETLLKRIEELLPQPPAVESVGTVALLSLRGGAGVTCLSVNLSLSLAVSQSTPVNLVDLTPMGGHAALMLGLRPTGNLFRLLAADGPISAEQLATQAVEHSSGLRLFASPPNFGSPAPLQTRLSQFVQLLNAESTANILDTPYLLEPNFLPLLKQVDRLVLVLSPDMPSVQSAVIALQGLRTNGFDDDRIVLVLNQVTAQTGLSATTIEKVIKRPVTATIPFEPQMLTAVNSGKPLVLNRSNTPVATAISSLIPEVFQAA